eukprot:TRINITY_DN22090_c0_g1_i1.p1 TRINITY_DN22090_c0_g1~~TRINITY_DN22090_c0_g1_i1.p1  ORF type:complete len:307 (-),score=47.96 TRINITY_DN22090_c0_g1_i1:37-957(-)
MPHCLKPVLLACWGVAMLETFDGYAEASMQGMAAFQEERVRIPVGQSWLSAKVAVRQSPVAACAPSFVGEMAEAPIQTDRDKLYTLRVIALHPWGPMGGSMDDPHPSTVCRLFGSAGCSTARFDFRRGIGSGATSVEDVRAVAAWLTEPKAENCSTEAENQAVASQVLIVGYSYGSIIGAAAAADIPAVIGYVTLGPPIDYGWALYVFNMGHLRSQAADSEHRPKLLVVGTDDQFCSTKSFQAFADELPEPKQSIVLKGVDHFSLFKSLPKVLEDWVISAFAVGSLQEFARGGVPDAVLRQAQRLS